MAVATIVVWMLILASVGWLVLRHDEASIMMQVKQDPELVVSGTVAFQGKPVSRGNIQLVFDEPGTGRHLASAVLKVQDGTFSTKDDPVVGPGAPKQLRISAEFDGEYLNAKQESKSVEASQVVYTNCAPPFSEKSVIVAFILLGSVVLGLIVIFTGNFTRTSAALLFGSAYLFTFLSVSVPIVGLLFVSQNHYLLETMKGSPMGIVVAKTKALDEPQWLLNVGGVVVDDQPAAAPATPTPPATSATAVTEHLVSAPKNAAILGSLSPAPAGTSVEGGSLNPKGNAATATPNTAADVPGNPLTGVESPPVPSPGGTVTPPIPANDSANSPAMAVGAGPVKDAAPVLGAHAAHAPDSALPPTATVTTPITATVHGGLAIPFYVIVLAIFGAGLKMMRRVPQIQAEHALALPEGKSAGQMMAQVVGLRAPDSAGASHAEVQASCDIRKGIIEQYMYLLSAPFLAIAVYYLLQILATNISEPVLVLMAFSAGLVSESIVSAVIQFAEKTLGSGREAGAGEGAAPDPNHQAAADGVE